MADSLEALAVDDRRSSLVILLLTDPHLLEGGEGGKDRAANPHRVLPLWGGNDLNDGVKNDELAPLNMYSWF